jgi:dihydroorotate dehydrogenase (NAD+) catalytic subunit
MPETTPKVAAPDLSVQVGPLRLRNPVLTASGTFGYGSEFAAFVDFDRLGGLVTKGISLAERQGNRPTRIHETAAGMLNAIGLQNVGFDRFVAEKLPFLERVSCAVVANVYGSTVEDYVELGRRFQAVDRVDAIELNVSCPNVSAGGVVFGKDPAMLRRVVAGCRAAFRRSLWVKLTPDVSDIAAMAAVCKDEGADAVSAVNTFRGMAVDLDRRRPVLANVYGGLSGPAIKPLALARVHEIARSVEIPIVGIGGIMDGRDALEFMLVGATAVQVGTANFVDPAASMTVVDGIADYLRSNRITRMAQLVRTAL